VLHREPRNGKTWIFCGSVLPNKEHVDAALRKLFEENSLTFTTDDLTLLIGNHVRVPLHVGQYHLVRVV
jgi:ADP-ribose pyrophosphatase YjhB (NUDIX family)